MKLFSHEKRKRSFFLIIFYITASQAFLSAQGRTLITIRRDSITVIEALKAVEEQSGMFVAYNESQLKNTKNLNLTLIRSQIGDALHRILDGTGFTGQLHDNLIIIVPARGNGQKQVSGTILDQNGDPVTGVSVTEKGAANGTVTALDGTFTLQVRENARLRISHIGYLSQDFSTKGRTRFNITLREDARVLNEVVVTALGLKRPERALSYNLQQVDNDDLTTVKSTHFIHTLAGKVAGVQINPGAAGPGAAAKVIMRGTKSISLSNNTLYVIDGIPMHNYVNGGQPGAFATQPGTESAADISPDDIESLSILTGASAAALYGYEGANGVILITTRRGHAGPATLTYSNSTTFSSPLRMPRFQHTYGNATGSVQSWGEPTRHRFNPRHFFNTGTGIINTLTLSTGNKQSQSYFSLSANNASGILPNNRYDRYNFIGRNTSTLFDGKIRIDAGIHYILQKNTNMVSQGQYFNPLPALYLFPRGEDFREVRLYERYDQSREVNIQYWPYEAQGLSLQNPYWIMHRMNRKLSRKRYILSTALTYNATEWLNITGRVNIDNTSHLSTDKRHAGTLATFAGPKGRYGFALRDEQQTYADIIAAISRKTPHITLTLNAGSSINDRRMQLRSMEGDLDKMTNWFTMENMHRDTGILQLDDDGANRQTQSLFANLEIGYRNQLYLTLTGRSDWDSALAWSQSKERSFFYPSAGLTALLHEMTTLPPPITGLKIRLAATSVGNSYAPYLTREFYSYDGQTGAYSLSRTRPNYHLRPEITHAYEAGINLKLLRNTLTLDLTAYRSDTGNQTHQVMEAGDTYDAKLVQTGNVRNSGIELALSYTTRWNHLSWTSDCTFTGNKNQITRLLDESDQYQGITQFDKATLGGSGSPIVRITKGGSMGDLYMTSDFKRDGNGYIYLDHATLLPSMTNLNPDQYIKLGTLLPRYGAGWRNTFTCRGLRLNILLSGRFGGLVVSNTQAILDRYGVSKHSADLRRHGGIHINQRNISARDYLNITGEGSGKADCYVYKADNVRLQEVSLEYTIPRQTLNNPADITLGLVAHNLALIYCKAPFDPEVTPTPASTYYTGVDYFMQPGARHLGFSLKLQF
ncbi:MAG: SusC/RagA family TonB-linked outer membrane protein [Proteiniphilum sp.]|jgi:TonB-linked SusC/RagA family outer membrane protein|nr:SusC/RagA family TonB-linked outer membrane protein [Proteiniphilum sp.]